MEYFIWRGPCQDAGGYKYRFVADLRLYRQYVAVACSRLTRYFKACYAPLSLSHRRTESLKEGRKAAREKESFAALTPDTHVTQSERPLSLYLTYGIIVNRCCKRVTRYLFLLKSRKSLTPVTMYPDEI